MADRVVNYRIESCDGACWFYLYCENGTKYPWLYESYCTHDGNMRKLDNYAEHDDFPEWCPLEKAERKEK
jgi:hypothetical protein